MHNRIRLVRKILNMSLEQFSSTLGYDIGKLYEFENLNIPISEEFILRICSTYDVNEKWLRTGHGFKGNLFLKKFSLLNELSDIKTRLVKLILCVDDNVVNDVFYDLLEIDVVNAADGASDIDWLISSYENELNSEKKGQML